MHGLFIDNFCGGGGASTGIAAALGRDIDVAVNHDPCAIAVHRANHPTTEHHCNDIRAVWPRIATRGRPVAGAWFSPDCKEFSKAKGGPVKDRSIRTLAMEIPHWLEETQPAVAYVENVEEFEDWGPLEQGEDGRWRVMLDRKGEDFKRWKALCRRQGYRVEHRQLRACDYGAPTSRKRLYIVMRRDRKPVRWPKPTHGKPGSPGVLSGKLQPYRTAAECIDWSLPCPSIFDRQRDLVDATKRRVAHGVMRYVVNSARPFIVPITHTQNAPRAHDSAEPLRTITTANGGEFMAADAVLAPVEAGVVVDRAYTNTRAARVFSPEDPLRTSTTQESFAAMQVSLAPHVTKFHSGSVGSAANDPMPTVTSNGEPARPAGATPLGLVEAAAVALDRQFGRSLGADVEQPMPATTAGGGGKTAQVSAFLTRFHKSNTNGGRGTADEPLGAVMAGGQHHGVVCAHIEQANTGGMLGRQADKPLTTITVSGAQQRIVETTLLPEDALPPAMMARANMVAAFLVKYYGQAAHGQSVDQPFDTVTTLPRFAVVTVEIDAVTYVIVDIGLRMLTPRELARAQGFPDSYVLDPVVPQMIRGKLVHKPLTKAQQIRMIGNSVCPDVARALVAANQPGLVNTWQGTVSEWRMAA